MSQSRTHFGMKLFPRSLHRALAPYWPDHTVRTDFNLCAVLQQYHEDGARIEAAFRRYIHRADPKQKEDSYEIIVCHANVIRYFVCRFVLRVGSSPRLLASLTTTLQLNPCFIWDAAEPV